MPGTQATWGIVATILAPRDVVLQFCAYHLRAGAHRLYIYLDDPEDAVFETLKAHPKIRPLRCDGDYWGKRMGKRPIKHQVRQTMNATHAYRRRADVDWLAHIDVDEFIVSDQSIGSHLESLPHGTKSVRVRPMEALAGDNTAFKTHITGPGRGAITARLYPTYGDMLRSGFLSHVAGKMIVRTGLENLNFRIHNVIQDDVRNPDSVEIEALNLAHLHAKSWEEFHAAYQFRLEKGSYRAELAPNRAREQGGVTLHEVLAKIADESGTQGLRAFYDEVCHASPALIQRLEAEGLLKRTSLRLEEAVNTVFPAVV